MDREKFQLFVPAEQRRDEDLLRDHALLDLEASGATDVTVSLTAWVTEPRLGLFIAGTAVRG